MTVPPPRQQGDETLVLAARSGESDAFGSLAQRWFDRCWDVAWRILRDRDHAADVAQDALLKAWQQLDRLEQPAAFGGWVLRIARNRALDRLEKERRAAPTDDHDALERQVGPSPVAEPEAELSRGQHRDLVWAAAAALGERDASMLDLHLRHGLEPHELAEELGIAPNAAHQSLYRLRKRLGGAIRANLLWRNGRPECMALRAELAAARLASFSAATVKAIDKHAKSCSGCADKRARVTAPAALFSAVPMAVPAPEARLEALELLSQSAAPSSDAGATTRQLPTVHADQPDDAGPVDDFADRLWRDPASMDTVQDVIDASMALTAAPPEPARPSGLPGVPNLLEELESAQVLDVDKADSPLGDDIDWLPQSGRLNKLDVLDSSGDDP